VELGSFTQRLLAGTVQGLVGQLKGIDEIKTVSVSIRRPRRETPGE
jgi:hypothetical protein